MKTKILYNLSLKDYNTRYHSRWHRLLKHTQNEVKEFDDRHTIFDKVNGKTIKKFDKFLLEGKSWAFINGTYYEIPLPPRLSWYVNLEKKAKALVTTACMIGILSVSALPICLYLFREISYEQKKDLFGSETEFVMKVADVTNTRVIIGKDFQTTVSIKQDMIEDYAIGNFDVYTYKTVEKKQSNVLNNNSCYTYLNSNPQNQSNETELVKVKLQNGKDYEYVNRNSSLDLLVYSESFNNKITIDLTLKDISFKYLVTYTDEIITYDTRDHHIPVKKIKQLPNDTEIAYTYDGTTQSTPFEFRNVGEYDVTVTITAAGFKTYVNTAKLTIVKGQLTDQQIKDYSFSTQKFRLHDRDSFNPTVVVADGGVPYINTPEFYYAKKGSNEWTTTVPTEIGIYEMKSELVFQNYKNYVLQKDLTVYQGDYTITFNVNTEGHWGKKGSTDSKTTKQILITKPTTFGEFKATIEDYVDPWREGHTFIGWYTKAEGGGLINDSTILTQIDHFDVYAHYTINSYDIETKLTDHVTAIEVNSSANYHEIVNVKASAETGYHIDKIVIQGTDSEEPFTQEITGGARSFVLSGSFQMPPSGVIITAYASITDFAVVPKPQDDGVEKINLSKVSAHYKDEVSVSVKIHEGYTLNRIIVYDYDNAKILHTYYSVEGGTFVMPAADVHIQVFTTINSYQVTLNSTDPNGKILDSSTHSPINNINVNYKEYLLANLNTYVEVTHPYAKLRGWAFNNDDEITVSTTMPYNNVIVKTLWDTYNIHIKTINCSVDKSEFTNCNIIHSEDIKITPNTDYHFHHFEYSTDNEETYHLLESDLPFTPYTLDSSVKHGQDIYLKAVCTNKAAVFAFANGGKFSDGTNYKAVETIGGTKFGTLGIEKPSKSKMKFSHWEDMNGNTVNDETIISDSIIIYAIYVQE